MAIVSNYTVLNKMGLNWEKYKLPMAILILFLVVIIFIMLNKGGKILSLPVPTPTPTPEPKAGLGSELYEESSNPVQNVPETNPFEAKTNPYKDVYKNPFQ